MSTFKLRYREHPGDEMYLDKAKAKSHVNGRAIKLLLATIIAVVCMLSFAGNVISYTHIRELQQTQDTHLLQYDSLLSAKLIVDQELDRLKTKLNTYPLEEKLIRVPHQEIAPLLEETSKPDENKFSPNQLEP